MTVHKIDVHVGKKLRSLRILAGYTQTQIANYVGVSFQQIQKYEIGSNRVAASRLYEISQFLNVPVNVFFPESDEQVIPNEISKEELSLVRAYRTATPDVRNALSSLAKSVSKEDD